MTYPANLEPIVTRGRKRRTAPAPVSLWAIRAWCAAIGIEDPRFLGEDGCTDKVVAPPPMLQCWAGAGLMQQTGADATLHAEVRSAFAAAGFGAVVATDYEQEFLADLRPGDIVHEQSRIAEISPLKRTRIGQGHFVTIEFAFETADRTEIGRLRARTFYYDPATADPDRRARPTIAIEENLAGTSMSVPITTTLVIAGSIASNDFEAVHHDPAAARGDGLADIILSIVTTAGLVVRYALGRVDRSAPLRRLQLRLGTPGTPGDVLRLTGSWVDGHRLAIHGDVTHGRHVEAHVEFGRASR